MVKGCTTAGIGCLDCKQPVIDAIIKEQQPWRERAERYLADPKQVHWIVEMGTERARTVAKADDEGRARRDGPELLNHPRFARMRIAASLPRIFHVVRCSRRSSAFNESRLASRCSL